MLSRRRGPGRRGQATRIDLPAARAAGPRSGILVPASGHRPVSAQARLSAAPALGVTHPANWGPYKLGFLDHVISLAGGAGSR